MRTGAQGQVYGDNFSDVAKLQSEIERLGKHIKEQALFLNGAGTEIKRLNAAYESSQATVLKYWEQRRVDHQIISELAEAWIRRDYPYSEDGEPMPLLQRAREAVRE